MTAATTSTALVEAPEASGALGARARRDLAPGPRAALDVAGRVVGLGFGVVSRLRGGKAVHPDGVVHAGTLRVWGDHSAPVAAPLLREPAEHEAIVRFSRSVGLPRPVPDLLGISLRLPGVFGPGRHFDLLAVTSIDAPVAHHFFVPATDFQQRVYSSSLPYRSGRESYLLGFRAAPGSPRPEGEDEYDRLARAAATGRMRFELCVSPLSGTFTPVAELRIGDRLDQALDATHFNPWNAGGGIAPSGLLNRLRDYAYPLSQAGWEGTRR
jgi:hypothetical protein